MTRRLATHGKKGVSLPAAAPALKTDLAKRLWVIRQRIVATGEPPLTWDEIEKELSIRRGESGTAAP